MDVPISTSSPFYATNITSTVGRISYYRRVCFVRSFVAAGTMCIGRNIRVGFSSTCLCVYVFVCVCVCMCVDIGSNKVGVYLIEQRTCTLIRCSFHRRLAYTHKPEHAHIYENENTKIVFNRDTTNLVVEFEFLLNCLSDYR